MTRRPFIVSFESFLPRFPDDHDHGDRSRAPLELLEEHLRARLADDRCIACLAYSRVRAPPVPATGRRARATAPRSRRSCACAIRSCRCGGRRRSPARASSSCCSSATTSCARAGPRSYAPTSGCAPPASPSRRRRLRAQLGAATTTSARARRAFVERELQRSPAPGVVHLAERPQRARAGADGRGRLLRPADVPRHVRLRRARVARRRHARHRDGHVRAARGRRARRATAI